MNEVSGRRRGWHVYSTVAIVVPVLAVGLRYAMRDSSRGRLVRLGGLAYTTYTWATVAIQVPFNELFLVSVVSFGLSLFTFVGGMVTHVIDLGVVVPSVFLAAAWLYRQRNWGYVVAGVVLVLGATLAAPIGSMTLVFASGNTVTISPVTAVFTFLPIVVSALLAVKYSSRWTCERARPRATTVADPPDCRRR